MAEADDNLVPGLEAAGATEWKPCLVDYSKSSLHHTAAPSDERRLSAEHSVPPHIYHEPLNIRI